MNEKNSSDNRGTQKFSQRYLNIYEMHFYRITKKSICCGIQFNEFVLQSTMYSHFYKQVVTFQQPLKGEKEYFFFPGDLPGDLF